MKPTYKKAKHDNKSPNFFKDTSADYQWTIQHSIIRSKNLVAKLQHIDFLCDAEGSDKEKIQAELTRRNAHHQTFVDLIKAHCYDNGYIFCRIMDSFSFSSKEITSFADIPDLKERIILYLTKLPPNESNLTLLFRCIDKSTSIGRFCWTKRSFRLFSADSLANEKKPTDTVMFLRDSLIPQMSSRLNALTQQVYDMLLFEESTKDRTPSSYSEPSPIPFIDVEIGPLTPNTKNPDRLLHESLERFYRQTLYSPLFMSGAICCMLNTLISALELFDNSNNVSITAQAVILAVSAILFSASYYFDDCPEPIKPDIHPRLSP